MTETAVKEESVDVNDAEADALVVASCNGTLDNEVIARVIRNIYGRLQKLEAENRDLKAKKEKKPAAKAADASVPVAGSP